MACAAGLATIEAIEEDGLMENAALMGDYARQRMLAMKPDHPLIGDVRGLGLLMGMELIRNPETREKATEEAEQVMYSALSKGLSFKLTMGSILTLTPPLTITQEEMDKALNILETCIAEVEESR